MTSCYFWRLKACIFRNLYYQGQEFNLEPQLFRTHRLNFERSILVFILWKMGKGECMMIWVNQNIANGNHVSLEERFGIFLQHKKYPHIIMVIQSLENLENLEKSGNKILVRKNLKNLEKSRTRPLFLRLGCFFGVFGVCYIMSVVLQ